MKITDILRVGGIETKRFCRLRHYGQLEFSIMNRCIYMHSVKEKKTPGMWNPSVNDLLADDWVIIECRVLRENIDATALITKKEKNMKNDSWKIIVSFLLGVLAGLIIIVLKRVF